jgi:hypothetical protein
MDKRKAGLLITLTTTRFYSLHSGLENKHNAKWAVRLGLTALSTYSNALSNLNIAVLNAKKQTSIRKKKIVKPQPLIKPEELAKKSSTSTPNSP